MIHTYKPFNYPAVWLFYKDTYYLLTCRNIYRNKIPADWESIVWNVVYYEFRIKIKI